MKFGLFLFALCSASMLSGASAQMEGHRVGDEICVEGYVMDDFCIQRGNAFCIPSELEEFWHLLLPIVSPGYTLNLQWTSMLINLIFFVF